MKGITKGSGTRGAEASNEGLNDATSQDNDSLLVPIYRIIAKNVKCIDLENIHHHHKRTNQKALNHFLMEIVRNCYSELQVECFRDYFCLNEKANLTIDMLKE